MNKNHNNTIKQQQHLLIQEKELIQIEMSQPPKKVRGERQLKKRRKSHLVSFFIFLGSDKESDKFKRN